MENTISKEKINKYTLLTSKAVEEIKKHIISGKEKEAKEIIAMAENYLSDAKHFEQKGKRVTAFAALNYAHGWIDAGVRLDIFNVTNRDLFTVKEIK